MPREYIDLISSDEEDEGVARTPIIDLTSDDEEVSRSMSSRSDYALHRVNQHQIQKNNQRSSSTRSIFTNLAERCRECANKFTSNDPPLSKRGSPDICDGCSTLNTQIKADKENPNDVKHWLCTGEFPEDDWEYKINNSREIQSMESRVGEMRNRFVVQRNRCKTMPSYGQYLPTKKDLLKLVANQGSKCAVVGWLCHFGYHCQKSWSLTIDHVVPISTAPAGMNPWVLSNLQVMCRLLNNIKDNHSDLEVRRWFKTWKDANIHYY